VSEPKRITAQQARQRALEALHDAEAARRPVDERPPTASCQKLGCQACGLLLEIQERERLLAARDAEAAAFREIVDAAESVVSEGVFEPSERYIRLATLIYAKWDRDRALAAAQPGDGGA
jgi:hypothetical protein